MGSCNTSQRDSGGGKGVGAGKQAYGKQGGKHAHPYAKGGYAQPQYTQLQASGYGGYPEGLPAPLSQEHGPPAAETYLESSVMQEQPR